MNSTLRVARLLHCILRPAHNDNHKEGVKEEEAPSQADGEIAEVRRGKWASEAVNDEVHARKQAKQQANRAQRNGAEEARCLLDAESE